MEFKIKRRAFPVNQAFKIRAAGRRAMMYRSKEYKKYKEDMRADITKIMEENGWKRLEKDEWFSIEILVKLKGGKRMDVDGPLKPLMDTLEDVVFENDFFCTELHVTRELYADEDEIIIEIRRNNEIL